MILKMRFGKSKQKSDAKRELETLLRVQIKLERQMRELIERNDRLTIEIHDLRRLMERYNVRIATVKIEIERILDE